MLPPLHTFAVFVIIAVSASGLVRPSVSNRRRVSAPPLSCSTRPQKKGVDTSDFPPPPSGGQGEWSDWDGDAYIGDGSDMAGLFGDDDSPIKMPVSLPGAAGAATAAAELSDDVENVDAVVKQLRDVAAKSRFAAFEDNAEDDIPPPPPGSRGEWSDWTGSASSSSSSSSARSTAWSPRQDREEGGRSASENWEGWSEVPPLASWKVHFALLTPPPYPHVCCPAKDAPYFDEAEVVDDEGNRGHSTDDRPKVRCDLALFNTYLSPI